MALEKLPHHRGCIDFRVRPRVAEPVDANDADLAAIRASFVMHGGQRSRWVVEYGVSPARVAARPPGERVGNALQPLLAPPLGVAVVGVLRVGEPVKGQHWHRAAAALTGGKPK